MAKHRGGEPHEHWVFCMWRGLGSFCSTIELHPRPPHFTRVLTGFVNLTNGGWGRKWDGRFTLGVMASEQIRYEAMRPARAKPPLALVKLLKMLDRRPDLLAEVRAISDEIN